MFHGHKGTQRGNGNGNCNSNGNANGGGGGLRGRSCEQNGMMFNRGRDRCLAQTLGNR